ncbi:patatin-like phospholipase family protein [Sphingomonas psychrotolerans]|uniref:PNPLA domain-containing protein n=1 Tax=Sphingomonas psychrotolerans TaxID=1327635 RepID=A0A2K8MIZ3_9SPHN|nr:patatin-like phospholipase family protein [Sphingomonas psychrotolerans]ATY32526.1 hypothetical protein CVN68_11525 [Sphingomonas psychrotolerans]
MALSGGGIRSATFSLGILQALSEHRCIAGIDYLSTVSGGSYIGSFFGALFLDPKDRLPSPSSPAKTRGPRRGRPDRASTATA